MTRRRRKTRQPRPTKPGDALHWRGECSSTDTKNDGWLPTTSTLTTCPTNAEQQTDLKRDLSEARQPQDPVTLRRSEPRPEPDSVHFEGADQRGHVQQTVRNRKAVRVDDGLRE